jgi:hypothetical protein
MFNNFFPPENRGVYEIMWKHMVQPDRPQMSERLEIRCDLHTGTLRQ